MSQYACPYADQDMVKNWHLKICRRCTIDGFTCEHWAKPDIVAQCPAKKRKENTV